ncbi:DUF3306 domain-containing protein [Roseovarius sp. CAU 1744]|uniref:DUF3306 domain-containing protein n=1 Tax=Roseovarius sp. CAU 1744 TaxID=3140368 RepID=UPI00325B829E
MTEPRNFWSRRKARVAEEAAAEIAADEARALDADQAGKSDEELLDELGLPDPDTMGDGDDFSAFMARAVPDRIRSRALRRLWLTNPVLANVDGLVDYGEDFTDAACVIENLSTSYQVGKGMKAHVEEMARQAELMADDPGEEDAGSDLPDVEEADEADEELLAETPDGAEEVAEASEDAPEAIAAAPRRRMRFSFNNDEVAQA